jgi:hypothetical protein
MEMLCREGFERFCRICKISFAKQNSTTEGWASASLFLKRLRAEIIQIFQNLTIISLEKVWKWCGFLILKYFVGFAGFLLRSKIPR